MTTDQNKERSGFSAGSVTILSAAHGLHDTYQAFLPPFIPIFLEIWALNKTQAGLLTAFSQIPSLSQPFIGYLADRRNLRWVVILAPAVTAVTMSLLGIAPGFAWIAFLLVVMGFSSASMHSVGPVICGHLSGKQLGRGMSFWMTAGELGRALGPLAVVSAIQLFGLKGTPWLMVFGLATSVALYFRLRKLPGDGHILAEPVPFKPALRSMSKFMLILLCANICGLFLTTGVSTFLPTYLTEKGASLWLAGASLTILELAGVAGVLVSGPLSDRLGRKPVLFSSFLLTPAFLFLFVHASSWMRIPLLMLLGFSSLAMTPVLMAWVQESFPQYRSLANGMYMAINFVLRSGIAIVLGWMGDTIGLQTTYVIASGVMLVGLPFILLLPEPARHKKADDVPPCRENLEK